MSSDQKDNNTQSLGGLDRRELAMIVIIAALGIVMVTYSVAIIYGFINAPQITIKGEIDLGQIQTIVLVIVSGGLIVLGITQGGKMVSNTVKENDETWMKSEDIAIGPPGQPGKRTGYQMPELYAKMMLLSTYVKKIYESDNTLTPKEQQEAIEAYEGITSTQMQALIPLTGPKLAESIRAIISAHRARNDRSFKDQF